MLTIATLLFVLPHGFAHSQDDEKNVRTFTNKDLDKYPAIPVTPPEQSGKYPDSIDTFSRKKPLDAEVIFRENSQAVAAIVSLDRKGNFQAYGSGFVISRDGLIVTNYHVVRNAFTLKVLIGKKLHPVQGLVYMDKDRDFSVLKVDVPNLHVVKLGSLDSAGKGAPVYVLSNPRAKEIIFSEGVIQGMKRFGRKQKMLQLTAFFSAGSSGGPVLNQYGEVIGIATAGISQTRNVQFAVPINYLKEKLTSDEISAFSQTFQSRDTKSADYWINTANNLYESGKYIEAIEAFQSAIKKDSKSTGAYNGLGVAYMKLQEYEKAEIALKKALGIEPDSAWVHSNLGLMYSETGRYEEAVSAFKEALKVNPDLEIAHLNLGNTYRWLKMYEEARRSYLLALGINPDSSLAHYSLGLTYRDLKDYDAARKEYRILKDIDPELAKNLLRWINR
jgi:tetratricopeptide (TPR) repeat protein